MRWILVIIMSSIFVISPVEAAPVYLELKGLNGEHHVIWFDRELAAITDGNWSSTWNIGSEDGDFELARLAGYACGSALEVAQISGEDHRILRAGTREGYSFTSILIGALKIVSPLAVGGWETGDEVAVLQENVRVDRVFFVGRYFTNPCR